MYPPIPPPSTSSAISWIGHWISQHTMRNYTRRRPSPAADAVLRDYTATNSHEYFADAFAFWIQNRDHEEQMKQLKEAAPETYAYLAGLESSGWSAQGWWLDLPPLASCLRNHSLNPCTRPFGGGAYPNAKMEEGFL